MNYNMKNVSVLLGTCLFAVATVQANESSNAVGRVHLSKLTNPNAIVEQIVRDNAPTNRSIDACAIVYSVADGKQMAIASFGELKPNTAFEPGSVIKPLTLVAAMEEGVAKADTLYSTCKDDPKYFRLPGDGCHVWPEKMSVGDGVVRSSNIVLGKLSVDVGVTNLVETLQAFGIGSAGGRLPRLDRVSRVMQPRIGIGQALFTTPDEIARAYVILANRGRSPWTKKRIVSAPTVEAVTEVLCRVVSKDGTARRAAVKGVSVAGKTGTVQMCVDGKYGDLYHATFVGFFPAEKPQYVVSVTYRTEKAGDYFFQGGHRSAVAFREIASLLMKIND